MVVSINIKTLSKSHKSFKEWLDLRCVGLMLQKVCCKMVDLKTIKYSNFRAVGTAKLIRIWIGDTNEVRICIYWT